MSPTVKYTLGRLGLFVVFFLVILPVPLIENILVKLMVALLLSALFSLVLLRRWRDEMAQQLTGAAQRRRAEREALRAALAGDESGETPGHRDPTSTAAAAAERAAAAATEATRRREHPDKR
jgi:type II secretory pathway pseudopilin PulG